MSGVPKPASLSVLKYLLSAFPAAIDNPAGSASLTPLALAFLTGRTDTASVLIGAGADQTTRSSNAKNLIHLVLIYLSSKSRSPEELILEFRSLLSLLDTRLLSSLWTERCRDNPGALTPLAFWLASIDTDFFSYSSRSGAKLVPEVLTVMLDFDGGEALTMIDGSGQFPLHQAVKQSYTGVVKLMLEHDPTLLARENAMGQTPLELAESLYVRDCAKGNPNIRASEFRKLEDRKCEDFAEHETRDIERGKKDENVVMETWRICKEFAMKKPTARILVSVSQAREVAKRLAERNKAKSKEENAEEGTDQERKDEVDDWLGFGALEMG